MNKTRNLICIAIATQISIPPVSANYVYGAFTDPPQPFVEANMTAFAWINTSMDYVPGSCTAAVFLYSADGKRRHEYTIDGLARVGPAPSDYTCFGVSSQDLLYVSQPGFPRLEAALAHVRLQYTRTSGPNNGWSFANTCISFVQTRFNVSHIGSMVECQNTPVPASCTVIAPALIHHTPVNVGRIRSRAYSNASVTCSARTGITVTTPEEINLNSGGVSISSRLYVQREGETSSNMVADLDARFSLISVIDTDQTTAGEYNGSGVIIVTWD